MSDFFDKETQEESSETSTSEPIKLGDQEYSQDELSRLVGLGRIAEEAESKYNTKIDKVWPDYGKTKNELRELREQKARWEQQQTQQAAIPEDEAIKQAREAAQKVGLITKDDFNNVLGQSFRQYYMQERAAEKLLDEATSLEGKYDGSNGLPKFDKEEILNYMFETGIKSPERAYKDKYETQYDQWKESELLKARRPGLRTMTQTSSGKFPANTKPTKENLNQLVAESLHLSDQD